MADATSPVYRALAIILDSCRALEPYLADGVPVEAREVSWPLLRILDAADDLVQFVNPDRDPAEYQGVPAAMLPPRTVALRFHHVDHPDWDFTAWFGEKASSLKTAAKRLVKMWNPTVGLSRRDDEFREQSDTVPERRRLALATVAAYAQLIFDQIHDQALQIEGNGEEA